MTNDHDATTSSATSTPTAAFTSWRTLLIFEFLGAVGAAGAAHALFKLGKRQDWSTPGLVLAVLFVWAVLMVSLMRATRRQPWWFETYINPDDSQLPPALSARIARAREQSVTFDGKVWRTGSAATELLDDGDVPHEFRWPAWLSSGHGVLVALGLAGTFFGLTKGLSGSIPQLEQIGSSSADPTNALKPLLNGAMLAFSKSLAGIVFATLWSLRLKHAESQRERYLHRLAAILDAERPLLSLTHVQVTSAARQVDTLATLTHQGREQHEQAMATWTGVSEQLANGFTQLGIMITKEFARTLEPMRQAIEKVPGGVTEDLGPKLDKIADALARLSEDAAGGIRTTITETAGKELSDLARALQLVVDHLQRLPPNLDQANNALVASHNALQADITSLQAALPAVAQAAGQLKQSGEAAGTALSAAAQPLRDVSGTLDATATALRDASGYINAQTAAATALRETLEKQSQLGDDLVAHLHNLVAETRSLVGVVEEVQRKVAATGENTGAASDNAVRDLKNAVETFSTSLAGIAAVLRQGTSEGASEAARIAQEASREISQAMSQLATHASTLSVAMQSAKESGLALKWHSDAMVTNVERIATPLRPVADALQLVPSELTEAATALASERTLIQVSGQQMQTQMSELRRVVGEIGDITTRQAAGLQTFKQGIVDVNATVVQAWQAAKQHALDGSKQLNEQLVTRAQAVEAGLRLPQDITDLNDTVTDLTSTLEELNATLAALRDRAESRP